MSVMMLSESKWVAGPWPGMPFDSIRELLKSDAAKSQSIRYMILLFVLQLPSVCARKLYPVCDTNKVGYEKPDGSKLNKNDPDALYKKNGDPLDKNLYVRWMRRHYKHFIYVLYGSASIDDFAFSVYNLRNDLTHEGMALKSTSSVVFLDDVHYGSMSTGQLFFIGFNNFCEMFLRAAESDLNSDYLFDSVFSDVQITEDEYKPIRTFISQTYNEFWDSRVDREDDLLLARIYQYVLDARMERVEEVKNKLMLCEESSFFGISCSSYNWPFSDESKYVGYVEGVSGRKCFLCMDDLDRMIDVVNALDVVTKSVTDEVHRMLGDLRV